MPTQQWPDPDFSAKPAVRDDIELPPTADYFTFAGERMELSVRLHQQLDAYARAAILADRAAGRASAEPEGFVLVPREPTSEMNSAAVEKGCGRMAAVMIYKAMLAAAPTPTASIAPKAEGEAVPPRKADWELRLEGAAAFADAYDEEVDLRDWEIACDGKPVMTFGRTASGDPKHPLMLGYDTALQPWRTHA